MVGAILLAAAAFAVFGGEYSAMDLVQQRRTRARLDHSIDSLRQIVDSLKRYERRLATDPALQEQLAREEFGMVRGERELLYRFAEPAPSAVGRGGGGSAAGTGGSSAAAGRR